MRRMRKAVAMVAVAAIAGVAALALTGAGAATATRSTMKVVEQTGPFNKELDQGAPGFDTGDQIIEIHDLNAFGSGERVGRAWTRIEVFRALAGGDLLIYIDCTAKLPGGKIDFHGVGTFAQFGGNGIVLMIAGGSGAYEGAGGTVTVTAKGKGALWTIEIV